MPRFLNPHIDAPVSDNLERAQRYLRFAYADGQIFSGEADKVQKRINLARKAYEVFGEDVTKPIAMDVLEECEALFS